MHLWWTLLFALCTMVEHIRSAATLPNVSAETRLRWNEKNNSVSGEKGIYSTPWPEDDVQLGCKELRAKRFISDGFCTSLKPIKEVVCAGHCMPLKEQNLPWWAEFTKIWAKPKFREWRCVEAIVKLKKVQLMCENGETRTYKIKIVKSCRCKSYEREPNRTTNKRGKRQNKDSKRPIKKKERERRRKERKEQRQKRLRRLNRNGSDTQRQSRRKKRTHNNERSYGKTRRRQILRLSNNSTIDATKESAAGSVV